MRSVPRNELTPSSVLQFVVTLVIAVSSFQSSLDQSRELNKRLWGSAPGNETSEKPIIFRSTSQHLKEQRFSIAGFRASQLEKQREAARETARLAVRNRRVNRTDQHRKNLCHARRNVPSAYSERFHFRQQNMKENTPSTIRYCMQSNANTSSGAGQQHAAIRTRSED
ncbi:hypothetical protein EVAR_51829_1 [Eumeta japonica]|uniref:Uncharacterized protein n=1 Tax=Eumeta variegata TaxID=151549 RepID=A0A4C1ZZT7_EUMVA|nr:hypothetical protein EVAR_51829_1 [Eumeta japonica]